MEALQLVPIKVYRIPASMFNAPAWIRLAAWFSMTRGDFKEFSDLCMKAADANDPIAQMFRPAAMAYSGYFGGGAMQIGMHNPYEASRRMTEEATAQQYEASKRMIEEATAPQQKLQKLQRTTMMNHEKGSSDSFAGRSVLKVAHSDEGDADDDDDDADDGEISAMLLAQLASLKGGETSLSKTFARKATKNASKMMSSKMFR